MVQTTRFALSALVAGFLAVGCASNDSSNKTDPDKNSSNGAKSKHVLDSEPGGAKGVKEVKQQAKDGDEIVVVGRIGGSDKPFTGRASFTIVDVSFKPCPDAEGCPTPWDYCCEAPDNLAKGTILVKFVDSAGKTLADDAKALLGVKELSTVVVRGQARRAEGNSISIVANGVFIRKN
jgi:hypothetical protein